MVGIASKLLRKFRILFYEEVEEFLYTGNDLHLILDWVIYLVAKLLLVHSIT